VKAYYFWTITDSYGDIPYFDALKGDGNLKYDKQSDIYPALIKELKEAVDQFDAGPGFKGDILYGNSSNGYVSDNAKWKKFANSMRLIMALRMSKVNATLAQTEFAAALAHPAGLIQSNSENAALKAPGGVFNHPLYQYYAITQRDDYAVSKTLMDYLAKSDERINAYGTSNVGFPYGLTRADAVAFTATPSGANYARLLAASQRNATTPIVIIGAANVYLARAEGAQRGWSAESVSGMYTLGVQRSWEQWGQSTATLATYLAQADFNIAVSPLQKIQLQEWIAWYPNGTQGWAEWRRTGVPPLVPAPGAGLPIIRRIPYGPNDYNFNLANATEAGARYTISGQTDSQNGKVWWDN
jgi:hypothetical protein